MDSFVGSDTGGYCIDLIPERVATGAGSGSGGGGGAVSFGGI